MLDVHPPHHAASTWRETSSSTSPPSLLACSSPSGPGAKRVEALHRLHQRHALGQAARCTRSARTTRTQRRATSPPTMTRWNGCWGCMGTSKRCWQPKVGPICSTGSCIIGPGRWKAVPAQEVRCILRLLSGTPPAKIIASLFCRTEWPDGTPSSITFKGSAFRN